MMVTLAQLWKGATTSRLLWSIVLIVLAAGCVGVDPAKAAPRPATEVRVHLGTPAAELRFVPDHLKFSVGQRYKLILDNPSSQKHYFTAKDFADGIWTQKVEAGNVEIKGAIHELELKAGAIAEWVFVPQRPGTYTLRCVIAGHTEAGMVGEIEIVPEG